MILTLGIISQRPLHSINLGSKFLLTPPWCISCDFLDIEFNTISFISLHWPSDLCRASSRPPNDPPSSPSQTHKGFVYTWCRGFCNDPCETVKWVLRIEVRFVIPVNTHSLVIYSSLVNMTLDYTTPSISWNNFCETKLFSPKLPLWYDYDTWLMWYLDLRFVILKR